MSSRIAMAWVFRGVVPLSCVLASALVSARASAEKAAAPAAAAAPAEPMACAHHEPLAAAEPLPSLSLYNLKAELVDQDGKPLSLAKLRGQPVLVTMFYSSCTSVCPMLIAQLQQIEALLQPATRSHTHVLLVSLDPQRDTPQRLRELAARHGVDTKRWHLTRTDDASLRKLAALLGIRYRKLPDGEIGHSPLIALLDRDGVLVSRMEGPKGDTKAMAKAIEAGFTHAKHGPKK